MNFAEGVIMEISEGKSLIALGSMKNFRDREETMSMITEKL